MEERKEKGTVAKGRREMFSYFADGRCEQMQLLGFPPCTSPTLEICCYQRYPYLIKSSVMNNKFSHDTSLFRP